MPKLPESILMKYIELFILNISGIFLIFFSVLKSFDPYQITLNFLLLFVLLEIFRFWIDRKHSLELVANSIVIAVILYFLTTAGEPLAVPFCILLMLIAFVFYKLKKINFRVLKEDKNYLVAFFFLLTTIVFGVSAFVISSIFPSSSVMSVGYFSFITTSFILLENLIILYLKIK